MMPARAVVYGQARGANVEYVAIDGDPALRAKMREMSGGRTSVPQVFIDGRHVGGFSDVRMLDMSGELEKLLTAGEPADGEVSAA